MRHPAVNELIQDPAAPFQALRAAIKSELHCALPGIVHSFDPETQTATIQPAIRSRTTTENGLENTQLPLLANVPVFFPGGGQYALTMPVQSGDECLVVFADSCIDAWWQSGGVQNQIDMRNHDLSDAFAFVGFRSRAKALQNFPIDEPSMIGGVLGETGPAGKSAYELWLEAGHTGALEDFLLSLIGANGSPGADGKSAYQIWIDEGHTGTVEDFLFGLIGANGSPGTDGKSAYQIWLDNGHTGTVADFLLSLIGPQGPAGSNATVTRENVEAVLTGEISSHKHDNSYVKKSGDTMTGKLTAPRLRATATTDVAGGANNDVAFIAGDESSTHIAMDGNEIMAKTNATTPGNLYLNSDGGDVYTNLKKVWHQGILKILEGYIGMEVTTTGTTVNTVIDLSSAGFTSAPTVFVAVRTSSPVTFSISTSTPTTTSVTIYLHRASGTGTTYVSWMAIGE